MLIDIYMKFREDSLNDSNYTTDMILCESKGNNSECINARVMVLALCMSSNVD